MKIPITEGSRRELFQDIDEKDLANTSTEQSTVVNTTRAIVKTKQFGELSTEMVNYFKSLTVTEEKKVIRYEIDELKQLNPYKNCLVPQ